MENLLNTMDIANGNCEDSCLSTYINLYKEGLPLKDFQPVNNQTYKVLRMSNVDIRVISRKDNYKVLVSPSISDDIKVFLRHSGDYFYMIPVQTPKGTIVGFIFRSVYGRRYHTYYRRFNKLENKLSFMFGFYKDFSNWDKLNKTYPIVICEGLKDCILLKKMYPYVLSNNGASLGTNIYVLRNLTNKFILVYDKDSTGDINNEVDKQKLQSLGCFVDIMKYDNVPGIKDLSDCIKDIRLLKSFKQRFIHKIKYLINN